MNCDYKNILRILYNLEPLSYYDYSFYDENALTNWFLQFNLLEKQFLKFLVEQLDYNPYKKIVLDCNKLYKDLIKNNGIKLDDTMFISSSFYDDKKQHISDLFFFFFLINNKVLMSNNSLKMNKKIDIVFRYKNVVIVDDFSGSGDTIIECIQELLKYICNIKTNIYIY